VSDTSYRKTLKRHNLWRCNDTLNIFNQPHRVYFIFIVEHFHSQELEKLKCDLEKFRELLLPLNKLLEWEQNYYPAVVVGVITVVFA